ncbi:MAG: DUF4476 domain-containing protein [Deltaproteobacteria bacterium]|nr:MAG: DUF4476 domain-containing protein [Deltaproteobacteria bacterium]
MSVSRFAPLWIPLALLGGTSAAGEPTDPAVRVQALLAEARAETRSIDELLDAAGNRSVQRELHRKTARLEQIYDELATLLPVAGDLVWQVDAPDGGVHVQVGAGGLSVSVSDAGTRVVGDVSAAVDDTVATASAPVSEAELGSILAAIDGESFSDGKLAVLRSAAAEHWFTADQARRVIEQFSFGEDKVAAGTVLFPRIVDPANWYRVYDAFDFDSDKEALRRAVGR